MMNIKDFKCIFSVFLVLSGCSKAVATSDEPTEEPSVEPTMDPEAEGELRKYKLLHSKELTEMNEEISENPSKESYLTRADALLEIAEKDLYEAYSSTRKDYVVVFFDNEVPEDFYEKLVKCYKAEADHAETENDIEAQYRWLERVNQLSPSEDNKEGMHKGGQTGYLFLYLATLIPKFIRTIQ